MEYARGGELFKKIKERGLLSESEARFVFFYAFDCFFFLIL